MDGGEGGSNGEARGEWPDSRGTGVSADLVVRRARPVLGTFVEIAVTGASPDELDAAIDPAFAAIETVHRLMSFHDDGSDVSRLNREASAGPVSVHPWTFEVLAAALDLYRKSDGVFDVAVAPVLQDLGLLPRHDYEARVRSTGVGEPFVLLRDGWVAFRDRRVRIDLGGIAKGYAVDRAVAVLRERGITQGIVNAGGDLAVFGPLPETIHIRDPRDPARAMCVVEIANAGLATSAGRFDPTAAYVAMTSAVMASTVIDPRTAAPVTGVVGATVRAPTSMLADALTKVVMAMGEAAAPLLAAYGARALFVTEHGVHVTAEWQDGVRLAA
jgi:FAD:protein FMN transferase